MNKKRIFKLLNQAATILIVLLFVANIYCHFSRIPGIPDNHDWPPVKKPLRYPQDIRILPPPPENIPYTEEELDTAINFLNLPTWSRSYVHCSNPESEVTCSQVILAYRTIKGWEDHISSIPLENRKYFVIKHPIKGMGNKMTTDINGFTMALMSNRSALVLSNFPSKDKLIYEHAYKYPSSVLTNLSQIPEQLHKHTRHFLQIPTDPRWGCFDVNRLLFSDNQFVGMDNLLYGSMVYVNKHTSEFASAHFGAHCAYFVGNYFSRFPDSAIQTAQELLQLVPPNQRVLGLHIRYHRAGQYYSHGFNQTMPIVYEEVDRTLAKEDLMLAVATDNPDIKKMMIERYGKRVLMTDVLRKPDKDHFGAQSDMALILGSDEI